MTDHATEVPLAAPRTRSGLVSAAFSRRKRRFGS